jgi:plastocyanin
MIDPRSAHPDDAMTHWDRRTVLRLGLALPVLGAGVVGVRVLGGRNAAAGQSTPAASPTSGCPATPAAEGSPVAPLSDPSVPRDGKLSPTAPVDVKMTQQLTFDPPELAVKVGQAVRWVNDSPLPHTATGDPEQNPVNTTHPEYVTLPEGADPWGSELLQPGGEYEHTFTVPGRYDYICIPHVLSGMRATITVEC